HHRVEVAIALLYRRDRGLDEFRRRDVLGADVSRKLEGVALLVERFQVGRHHRAACSFQRLSRSGFTASTSALTLSSSTGFHHTPPSLRLEPTMAPSSNGSTLGALAGVMPLPAMTGRRVPSRIEEISRSGTSSPVRLPVAIATSAS